MRPGVARVRVASPHVTVEVLNASARLGVARLGTRVLREAGIDVVSVGNARADSTPLDSTRIVDYHMHIYYDPESRERAALLRQWVEERFPVRMGRWHDAPVGPHPTSMYQVQAAGGITDASYPSWQSGRQAVASASNRC